MPQLRGDPAAVPGLAQNLNALGPGLVNVARLRKQRAETLDDEAHREQIANENTIQRIALQNAEHGIAPPDEAMQLPVLSAFGTPPEPPPEPFADYQHVGPAPFDVPPDAPLEAFPPGAQHAGDTMPPLVAPKGHAGASAGQPSIDDASYAHDVEQPGAADDASAQETQTSATLAAGILSPEQGAAVGAIDQLHALVNQSVMQQMTQRGNFNEQARVAGLRKSQPFVMGQQPAPGREGPPTYDESVAQGRVQQRGEVEAGLGQALPALGMSGPVDPAMAAQFAPMDQPPARPRELPPPKPWLNPLDLEDAKHQNRMKEIAERDKGPAARAKDMYHLRKRHGDAGAERDYLRLAEASAQDYNRQAQALLRTRARPFEATPDGVYAAIVGLASGGDMDATALNNTFTMRSADKKKSYFLGSRGGAVEFWRDAAGDDGRSSRGGSDSLDVSGTGPDAQRAATEAGRDFETDRAALDRRATYQSPGATPEQKVTQTKDLARYMRIQNVPGTAKEIYEQAKAFLEAGGR